MELFAGNFWLPYKLRFLGFKLEKYFEVFKDPKIRVMIVFLRYGSKVKKLHLKQVLGNFDRSMSLRVMPDPIQSIGSTN